MLEKVLREIKNTGYISKARIAAALQTNTGLIEDAFTQLVRLGYIKVTEAEEANGRCNRQCASCPAVRHCPQLLPLKLVTITAKGERLLRQTI